MVLVLVGFILFSSSLSGRNLSSVPLYRCIWYSHQRKMRLIFYPIYFSKICRGLTSKSLFCAFAVLTEYVFEMHILVYVFSRKGGFVPKILLLKAGAIGDRDHKVTMLRNLNLAR